MLRVPIRPGPWYFEICGAKDQWIWLSPWIFIGCLEGGKRPGCSVDPGRGTSQYSLEGGRNTVEHIQILRSVCSIGD